MTIESAQVGLRRTRELAHSHCVVCGHTNSLGLRLDFSASDDGHVQARFDCGRPFEGYAGIVHGGVIASLLDGAMTNCMFARGIPALTAELTVRYRHPLVVGTSAVVRARVERSIPPLHLLKAEIVQAAQVKATACGKFMEHAYAGDGGEASL
ncbi:MAG: PaaI family thioesterase [Planctomycetota bacterium]